MNVSRHLARLSVQRSLVFLGILTVFIYVQARTIAQEDRFSHLSLPSPIHPSIINLVQNDQPQKALDALNLSMARSDSEPPLESIVLRATLLNQTGQARESRIDWQTVIDRAVFMRTFARRAIVNSLVDHEIANEAVLVLDQLLRSDFSRHRDLVLRVANFYVNSKNLGAAKTLYHRVLASTSNGVDADAARIGLALAQQAEDDTVAALRTLHQAQLKFHSAKMFIEAQRLEQNLSDTSRVQYFPFTEAEYQVLVQRLRIASEFQSALDLIDQWNTNYPRTTLADRISVEQIETLYAQRANVEAVLKANQFYVDFPDSPLGGAVKLTEFRLAVRMGNFDRARELGLALWEDRVPQATTSQRRSAALLLGAYSGAIGRNKDALELYRSLFRSSKSASEQRDLLWRAGVAALRADQNERALSNLSALVARQPTGDLGLAADYWLAVAQSRNGDISSAIRGLNTLAARYPYHYYGLTATTQLMQLAEQKTTPNSKRPEFPALSMHSSTKAQAEYKAAMVLARAGLIHDAAWYLRRLLERRTADKGLALLAARASAQANDHANVTRIIVNHFGEFLNQPSQGLPGDFWTLVYPRPFWDVIVKASETHGSDPTLLVSLMRRESRFNPTARSPVGAIGLLQIMPNTARALAQRAGVTNVLSASGIDEEKLALPSVNIQISARLNADLLQLFNHQRIPTIASYNAGEDRAAEWWTASSSLSFDFFVDTIPYRETRNFAREVLANYAAYERVYADR